LSVLGSRTAISWSSVASVFSFCIWGFLIVQPSRRSQQRRRPLRPSITRRRISAL
jgi:hypothetical protein